MDLCNLYCREHSVEDLSIGKTRIRATFKPDRRSADRKCRRHKLWVPVSAVQWATCPLVEKCQWMAACNPSLSFTAHSRASSLVLLLYDRSFTVPLFLSHLRCTVTSLIPGRQTDRRTLKPCSQRAFPIFHLRSTGKKGSKYPRAFLSPRPCRDKTAATERIDASCCKFVLFFTAGHPVAMPTELRRTAC